MSIDKSGWSKYNLTRDDFQRLWDLPYGAFSSKIKALAKEKFNKNFFPQMEMTITRTVTQTIVMRGESEDSIKSQFYGSRNPPFADAKPQERILFQCRQI